MNGIKALKALAFGQEVEIEGRTYKLEKHDNKYFILVKCQTWRGGKKFGVDEPDIEWLGTHDMSLEYFLAACDTIPSEDLFILGAERAITKINRGE